VIHDPVIINQDNVILDGHRTFKACRELATFHKEDFKGGPFEESTLIFYVVT
jgi:hypothetical protein